MILNEVVKMYILVIEIWPLPLKNPSFAPAGSIYLTRILYTDYDYEICKYFECKKGNTKKFKNLKFEKLGTNYKPCLKSKNRKNCRKPL